MKSLLVMLLPFILLAQTDYPDALHMYDGRIYQCLITKLDESSIKLIYSKNVEETTVLTAVTKISLEDHGVIYENNKGYASNLESLKKFVDNRYKTKIEREQEAARIAAASDRKPGIKNEISINERTEIKKLDKFKKWSFGVLLIPYYSGKIYQGVNYGSGYSNPLEIITYATNEINMEWQVAYGVLPYLRLAIDGSYSGNYQERLSDYYYKSEYNENKSSYKYVLGLDLLDIGFSAKYYFKNMFSNDVTVFALAGVGKQFAFAEIESKNLLPQPDPPIITEDNLEEFTTDMNSPWRFNIGFGAEYFFNKALSLNSTIRFLYSKSSGKYKYRSISDSQTLNASVEEKRSSFITRVGLGLNFYF